MKPSDGDPVGFLVESLRFYSPTKKESEFAGFLADKMRGYGYSNVRTDRAGNVTGEAGRGRINMLLCGHMDTVPGELRVRRTKELVYGRGAADAKSPLCALLLAGSSAVDSDVRVTFAGVTEEEGDGAGIEELVRARQKYGSAVFGEPSGAHKITIGYRGRVSLRVVVKTPGGHAGASWVHRSAFDEFSTALSRIKDFEASKQSKDDHFRSLSVTPTLVSAGSFHNVVPASCEATLDVRIPPTMTSSEAVRGIREAARTSAEGVSVIVSLGEPTEPYEADPGSTLVRAFQRAILLRLKTRPSLVRKTGTGDMNTFAHKRGTECITYGPGDPMVSHTDNEVVSVGDYLASIDVAEEAISQVAAIEEAKRS